MFTLFVSRTVEPGVSKPVQGQFLVVKIFGKILGNKTENITNLNQRCGGRLRRQTFEDYIVLLLIWLSSSYTGQDF